MLVLIGCSYLFVLALLAAMLWRARPQTTGGNLRAAAPAVALSGLAVAATAGLLIQRSLAQPPPLRIDLTAWRGGWRADYPPQAGGGGPHLSGSLRLLAGRKTLLAVRARDGVHILRIPGLVEGTPILPERVSYMSVAPPRPARVVGGCDAMCGWRPGDMALIVEIEPAAAFDVWRASAR